MNLFPPPFRKKKCANVVNEIFCFLSLDIFIIK